MFFVRVVTRASRWTCGPKRLISAQAWAPLPGVDLRHASAVVALYPNAAGTRFVVVDAQKAGYVYNPVGSELTPIPGFPRDATAVLWDDSYRYILM